jgi:hypothetical protein
MASTRALTELSNDQFGQYTIFISRNCKVCTVQLTSRNRHDHQNFCKTHGLEQDRARMEQNRRGNKPVDPRGNRPPDQRTGTTRVMETHHAASPDKQKVHSLLTKFLINPRSKISKDELLSSLVDYELINRFRDL